MMCICDVFMVHRSPKITVCRIFLWAVFQQFLNFRKIWVNYMEKLGRE